MRVSLGATRWRVIRQLLMESVLLSVVAGLAGLGIAMIGIRFRSRDRGCQPASWIQFTMDGTVFFFAAVCLGTGIVFGLAPAIPPPRPTSMVLKGATAAPPSAPGAGPAP